jgi:hypothetical protein
VYSTTLRFKGQLSVFNYLPSFRPTHGDFLPEPSNPNNTSYFHNTKLILILFIDTIICRKWCSRSTPRSIRYVISNKSY